MRLLSLLLLLLPLAGCTSLYYKAQEKIGHEKRDILADRVKKGRKEQEEAKKQYQTTLEAFQAATGFSGGRTEEVYKKLKHEYDEAADRTRKVSERIASIEEVAGDLFREWDQEVNSMSNRDLRERSRTLLRQTRARYVPLVQRMKEVERRAKPVLKAFEDQVLFLKHNLNAEAIGSLKTTISRMDADVTRLVADIEASTREADAFLATLPAS